MPRVQIEATELKNTDVSFVSLVKHGANRIPFRILKEENETMLDLAKIGRTLFRKADAPQAVVSVLVRKGADTAALLEALTSAGLVTTQKAEQDDMIVFAQPGAESGDRDGVLQLNADVALVVNSVADLPSRVQKDFQPWNAEGLTFMQVLNTQSFMPATSMALDALMTTIMNIMDDAEDAGAAATAIGSAIDDFKAYVVPCVQGIPVRAFKADAAVAQMAIAGVVGTDPSMPGKKPGNQTEVSGSGVGAGANANGTGYDPVEDAVHAQKAESSIGVGVNPEPSMVNGRQEPSRPTGHGGKTPMAGESSIGVGTSPESAPAEAAQGGKRPTGHGGKTPMAGEAPIGTGVNPERGPVEENQATSDNIAALMKGVQDTLASLVQFREDVLGSLTQVQKDVAGVNKSLTEVDARVKKTEEAVLGTSLGDVGEDPEPRQRTTKSDGTPPLLDTGLSRRHAA